MGALSIRGLFRRTAFFAGIHGSTVAAGCSGGSATPTIECQPPTAFPSVAVPGARTSAFPIADAVAAAIRCSSSSSTVRVLFTAKAFNVDGHVEISQMNHAIHVSTHSSAGVTQLVIVGGDVLLTGPGWTDSILEVPAINPRIEKTDVDRVQAGLSAIPTDRWMRLSASSQWLPTEAMGWRSWLTPGFVPPPVSTFMDSAYVLSFERKDQEDIDGVTTTRYVGLYDPSSEASHPKGLTEVEASRERGMLQRVLPEGAGLQLEVWIDESGHARQVRYQYLGQDVNDSGTFEFRFLGFGDAVSITTPPPADTVDIDPILKP